MLQLLVLAVIQGITEFLPISSSGHLVILPQLTSWPDQGLILDVAVHVGTLLAVLLYFCKDLFHILLGFLFPRKSAYKKYRKLGFALILATIPVVVAGYFLHDYDLFSTRSLELVGWTTLGFGVLLYIADKICMTVNRIEHMTYKNALIIGFFQVLALLPGTSRSGITMTGARFLGFERAEAARFSMLMSIPTIIAAAVLTGLDLYNADDLALTKDALTAAGIAFITALLAIWILMGWLRRSSFTPFVIYRILLGGFLLYWVYNGPIF